MDFSLEAPFLPTGDQPEAITVPPKTMTMVTEFDVTFVTCPETKAVPLGTV
jgi:excinuclease UvrABC helicase subunit UvrB